MKTIDQLTPEEIADVAHGLLFNAVLGESTASRDEKEGFALRAESARKGAEAKRAIAAFLYQCIGKELPKDPMPFIRDD